MFALHHGCKAEDVRPALTAAITCLPVHLRRSLTRDQGKEMAEHARSRVDGGVTVYFCDPPSPWQRGTSENTNGLLRLQLPQRSDFSGLMQRQLDAVAAELNGRPRETLGWRTPAECFALLRGRR